MSARLESTVAAKTATPLPPKVIVNFDLERLKAPFLLRCGALLIDYILLVSVPVVAILLARAFEDEPSKFLKNANTGWLIMILFGITNFVIFPMFSSQTIGKILTGLRIVKTDGSPPSFSRLLVRHLIGYPLTGLSFGLGFLFAILNIQGRALHDFLAGTVVVYGSARQEKV